MSWRQGQPQRRIVLFGLFGVGNLGNDATLWVTLDHLRRRQPNAEVACVCPVLPSFAQDHDAARLDLDPLPPRGRWRIGNETIRNAYLALATLLTEPLRRRRVRRQLGHADKLVVVGTGALDDFGEMPWGMPAWILRWCRAAHRAGAEVRLLSVGVGPIHGRMNRLLMHRAIRAADARSFRDEVSVDYVARHGMAKRDDAVVPDLVFAFPTEWVPLCRSPVSPPRVVGVGLMGYYGWSNDKSRGGGIFREYIEKMTLLVRWLLDQGYTVRLLIGELRTDDVAIADVLRGLGMESAADRDSRLISRPIDSIRSLLNEIAQTDIVIASRFHNVVCSLALSRPVVSIGYAGKFEALMRDMGLGDYCQGIETLEIDRLQQQFLRLAKEHAGAVEVIRQRSRQYRQRLDALYDSAFGDDVSTGETQFRDGERQRASDPSPLAT